MLGCENKANNSTPFYCISPCLFLNNYCYRNVFDQVCIEKDMPLALGVIRMEEGAKGQGKVI